MKIFPVAPIFLMALIAFSVLPSFPQSQFISQVEAQESPTGLVGSFNVDWSDLWQKIHRHLFWDLEWFNSTSSTWISNKKYLVVQKTYLQNDTCKIALNFTAPIAGNYRITFAIDVVVKDYVTKLEKYQYELSFGEFSIVFDWSDVVNIPGLQITHGIKTVDGSNYFWFRLRRDNIPKGYNVVLDPTILGTSSSLSATSYPFQRKSYYDNKTSRFYGFYSDGTAMLWSHSIDGVIWTSPTKTIRFLNASWGEDAWGGTPEESYLWMNIANAFDDDSDYAYYDLYAGTGEDNWLYLYDYDDVSPNLIPASVRLRIDSKYTMSGGYIGVRVSWDGGVTWGSAHLFDVMTTWKTTYVDVTSDTDWNSSKLNDIWVKIWVNSGYYSELYYLDWLSVEVTNYPSQCVRTLVPQGYKMSFAFDYDYFYYVFADYLFDGFVYFRQGSFSQDGTLVNWLAEEQLVNQSSLRKTYPHISIDSNGYPWICYQEDNLPFVTKSSTKNGVWTTASGFPIRLRNTGISVSCALPLTEGKMYVIWNVWQDKIYGKLWNGTAFGSVENCTSSNSMDERYWSVLTYDDDVHVVFEKRVGTYDFLYVNRTYSIGWGAEKVLITPGGVGMSPVISRTNSGNLYVFWANTPNPSRIYIMRCMNGTWDNSCYEWIYEAVDGITYPLNLSAFVEQYGSFIGLLYVTKGVAPLNVKFRFLAAPFPLVEAPKLNPVARFSDTISTVYVNEDVFFDGSMSYDPDGGSIIDYKWTFGDGNIVQGNYPTTTHKWSTAATYTINLTVTDDESAQDSFAWTIEVIDYPSQPPPSIVPPPAVIKAFDLTVLVKDQYRYPIEDADVKVYLGGEQILEGETDEFGAFIGKRLTASKTYTVKVIYDDRPQQQSVSLDQDKTLTFEYSLVSFTIGIRLLERNWLMIGLLFILMLITAIEWEKARAALLFISALFTIFVTDYWILPLEFKLSFVLAIILVEALAFKSFQR